MQAHKQHLGCCTGSAGGLGAAHAIHHMFGHAKRVQRNVALHSKCSTASTFTSQGKTGSTDIGLMISEVSTSTHSAPGML